MFTFLPRDVCFPQLDGNENDDHHETKDQTRHQEDQPGWVFATSSLHIRVIEMSWEQTLCSEIRYTSSLHDPVNFVLRAAYSVAPVLLWDSVSSVAS